MKRGRGRRKRGKYCHKSHTTKTENIFGAGVFRSGGGGEDETRNSLKLELYTVQGGGVWGEGRGS